MNKIYSWLALISILRVGNFGLTVLNMEDRSISSIPMTCSYFKFSVKSSSASVLLSNSSTMGIPGYNISFEESFTSIKENGRSFWNEYINESLINDLNHSEIYYNVTGNKIDVGLVGLDKPKLTYVHENNIEVRYMKFGTEYEKKSQILFKYDQECLGNRMSLVNSTINKIISNEEDNILKNKNKSKIYNEIKEKRKARENENTNKNFRKNRMFDENPAEELVEETLEAPKAESSLEVLENSKEKQETPTETNQKSSKENAITEDSFTEENAAEEDVTENHNDNENLEMETNNPKEDTLTTENEINSFTEETLDISESPNVKDNSEEENDFDNNTVTETISNLSKEDLITEINSATEDVLNKIEEGEVTEISDTGDDVNKTEEPNNTEVPNLEDVEENVTQDNMIMQTISSGIETFFTEQSPVTENDLNKEEEPNASEVSHVEEKEDVITEETKSLNTEDLFTEENPAAEGDLDDKEEHNMLENPNEIEDNYTEKNVDSDKEDLDGLTENPNNSENTEMETNSEREEAASVEESTNLEEVQDSKTENPDAKNEPNHEESPMEIAKKEESSAKKQIMELSVLYLPTGSFVEKWIKDPTDPNSPKGAFIEFPSNYDIKIKPESTMIAQLSTKTNSKCLDSSKTIINGTMLIPMNSIVVLPPMGAIHLPPETDAYLPEKSHLTLPPDSAIKLPIQTSFKLPKDNFILFITDINIQLPKDTVINWPNETSLESLSPSNILLPRHTTITLPAGPAFSTPENTSMILNAGLKLELALGYYIKLAEDTIFDFPLGTLIEKETILTVTSENGSVIKVHKNMNISPDSKPPYILTEETILITSPNSSLHIPAGSNFELPANMTIKLLDFASLYLSQNSTLIIPNESSLGSDSMKFPILAESVLNVTEPANLLSPGNATSLIIPERSTITIPQPTVFTLFSDSKLFLPLNDPIILPLHILLHVHVSRILTLPAHSIFKLPGNIPILISTMATIDLPNNVQVKNILNMHPSESSGFSLKPISWIYNYLTGSSSKHKDSKEKDRVKENGEEVLPKISNKNAVVGKNKENDLTHPDGGPLTSKTYTIYGMRIINNFNQIDQ